MMHLKRALVSLTENFRSAFAYTDPQRFEVLGMQHVAQLNVRATQSAMQPKLKGDDHLQKLQLFFSVRRPPTIVNDLSYIKAIL